MSVDDVQIGKNFARLRGERSQKEVADLMRARGFRWSQATVWSIEKGERPLRVAEAQVAAQVLGQPFYDFAADDGAAQISAWMRECSEAAQQVDAAITRFEQARFNLAISEHRLPDVVTNRLHDAGGWLSTTVDDLVREHRERDNGDESIVGLLSGVEGDWVDQYNATIAKEYPDVEHPAED